MGSLITENSSETASVDDESNLSDNNCQNSPLRFQWYHRLCAVCLVAAGIVIIPPIIRWQRMSQERALSLSNIRRVSLGALLYAQDWDSCTMPPPYRVSESVWQTWPSLLRPYVSPDSTFSNPSNPVNPFMSGVRDPESNYPVNSSYAVNRRLWNTFAPGPYPLDNLELPDQTVFFVEAGRMWNQPTRTEAAMHNIAVLEYGDTTDRFGKFCPYPSTHDSRMAIVAADGHGTLVTVLHYSAKDGPHDTLYGRIGSGIYNWNGGHPNGETDKPARE